jgi:hypothetical protein
MKGQGVVKVPLFSGIFNFRAEYLGNKILYSNTSMGFFYPHDKENRFHPLLKWFDRCIKTTPPGRPHPPKFFFNPQTSLKGPPWFRKTSLRRDLNFHRLIDLLKDSALNQLIVQMFTI